MRRFTAWLLAVCILGTSASAFAQDENIARAAVRDGVRDLRDYSTQTRTSEGWGNIVGGVVSGGLSGWLLVEGLSDDNTSEIVLGAAFGVVTVSTIVGGIYTLSNASAVEQTSQLLLDNESTLATTGYVFLAHEAERARQTRILQGMLGIASGLSSGLLLIPVLTDDSDETLIGLSDTWWIVIIGGSAALGVINGTLALVSESVPETIFRQVQSIVGGQAIHWSISPGAVSDGRSVGPGLSLEARF